MPKNQKNLLLDLPKEIRNLILSHLDQGSILSLGMTCTTLRHQVNNNAVSSTPFPLQVALGASHSMILSWHLGQPMLRAAGGNCNGQLGLGDHKNRHHFTQVKLPKELSSISKLSARFTQTMIIGQDKQNKPVLYVCGLNINGQLALGDKTRRNSFTQVNLPTEIVFIHKISMGDHHTILYGHDVDNKPLIYACGSNCDGQLGLGDNIDRSCFTKVEVPDGVAVLDDIVAGKTHTMLYGRNKKNQPVVYACGSNQYGQLGLGDNSDKNCLTQLCLPKECSSIKSLKAGNHHTLLLGQDTKDKPLLYTCGYSSVGQLGHGDNQNRNIFTKVSIPEEINYLDKIIGGSWNSFLVGRNSEKKEVLYHCGSDLWWRTGVHEQTTTFTPIILPTPLKELNHVIAGLDVLFIIGRDAEKIPAIYAYGRNYCGQLGLGHNKWRTSFTSIKNNHYLLKQKSIEILEAYCHEENEKHEPFYIGFFKPFFSDVSKTQTLKATQAVIDFLKYNIPIDKIHEPALNNGRLSEIIKERQIELMISDAPVLTI